MGRAKALPQPDFRAQGWLGGGSWGAVLSAPRGLSARGASTLLCQGSKTSFFPA